eukprot:6076859-Amphidinium_carterae.1
MQSAGLNLAPMTPTIKIENFSNPSGMPKSTSSSTTSGPSSMSGTAAELPPVLQVYWIKPSFKSCEVSPPESELLEQPRLTVLSSRGTSLAPSYKAPSG